MTAQTVVLMKIPRTIRQKAVTSDILAICLAVSHDINSMSLSLELDIFYKATDHRTEVFFYFLLLALLEMFQFLVVFLKFTIL